MVPNITNNPAIPLRMVCWSNRLAIDSCGWERVVLKKPSSFRFRNDGIAFVRNSLLEIRMVNSRGQG